MVTDHAPVNQIVSKLAADEFTPLTGINVDWAFAPLEEVLAKIAQDTVIGAGGGRGAQDIFYLDQPWLGRFVNDVVHVDTLLAKPDLAYPGYNFADFLPQIIEGGASVMGATIGVPVTSAIFIMMYRKDIFDELKLKLPTTMTTYLDTVKAIYEAKSGQGIMGTVGQWKSGDYGLQCDASAWLWSHGASHFGADGKPSYTTDAAVAGMAYMLELGKYMDPGVTDWDAGSEGSAFTQGKAGICLAWSTFFPDFDDPSKSNVIGLVDVADVPTEDALLKKEQCGFGETPGLSRQAGACLALSKYAPNPDPAWLFMQWATSADVCARANAIGANAPVRTSTFADPRVVAKRAVMPDTTRHFAATKTAIESRMGTEPHLRQWASLVVDVNAVEYGKMTAKEQGIKETLQAIQNKTTAVLAT